MLSEVPMTVSNPIGDEAIHQLNYNVWVDEYISVVSRKVYEVIK